MRLVQLLLTPLRPLLYRTLYPVGSVRAVLAGPARGLRYRMFSSYGLAPLYGAWEREVQDLVARHLGPGGVAYDLGANYGLHTLLMARRVGKEGHVYAFEPVPELQLSLRENVGLNGFGNVTCLELAVSDATGTASFFLLAGGKSIGSLAETGVADGAELVVNTVSLDDFVFERGGRPPTFVKVDVEGAESRVLTGARRVLAEHHPILLVELHTPEQDVAVGRILVEHGYEAYRVEDGSRIRDLSRGWPHPEGIWGQFIALPAGARP